MKLRWDDSTLFVLVLLAAATFPGTARAVLWKTEAQLTALYGEPVEIHRGSDSRSFFYQIKDLKLRVQFQDDVSQSIWYTHEKPTKPFSSEEIESLLKANSDGQLWHQEGYNKWGLGAPPIARACVKEMEIYSNGKAGPETHFSFDVETVAFEKKETAKMTAPVEPRSRTGAEKLFQGVLEFRDEEDDSRVAIVQDGKSVLEIPWAWRNHTGRAKLEAGQAYEITLRDEELFDMDAAGAFVSDRIHKSHHARVYDSEFFVLVRIKHAGEVVFDESICEVHKTPMQRKKAEMGYGMYGPASKADAVCDEKYPHHSDWIRGGCMVGDVTSAFHYVCPECVAATAKYKREHPEETARE